jgi:hypothetical protein
MLSIRVGCWHDEAARAAWRTMAALWDANGVVFDHKSGAYRIGRDAISPTKYAEEMPWRRVPPVPPPSAGILPAASTIGGMGTTDGMA